MESYKSSAKTTNIRKRATDQGPQCEDNKQNGHEEGGHQRHDFGSHSECQWPQRTVKKGHVRADPKKRLPRVLGQCCFVPTWVGEMPQKPNPIHVNWPRAKLVR